MTIKEIIELQDTTGHLYLLRQGLFYRGYNQTAAFLSNTLGYRLFSREVKSCGGKRLFYVGFPATAKEKVFESAKKQGGVIEQSSDNVLVISGISIMYDESALSLSVQTPSGSKGKRAARREESSLAADITDFNLTGSTPMECMNFIARLQDRLNRPEL